MNKEDYIKYLRNQAYWIIVFADDLEKGTKDSEWAVDFDLKRPDCMEEMNEEGLKHSA